jgi:metal-responsive CopG/Arc/MetJ family transcriptional regulator
LLWITTMEKQMSITITVPEDVIKEIDRLRQPELLTRSQWLRREVTQAMRALVFERSRVETVQ